MKHFIVSRLVYIIYRTFMFCWRTRIEEHPEVTEAIQNNDPLIFAFWHGDELALVQTTREYHYAVMTSHSSDGAIMTYVVKKLGGNTARGSSSRGGVGALKGLVRLIKEGWTAGIAVDGPKGPIYKVKPGVFEVSRLAKARVVPVGAAARRKYIFEKAWNKAMLPWPFTLVGVYFAQPWPPLTRADDPKSLELGEKLASAITDAQQQARNIIADK